MSKNIIWTSEINTEDWADFLEEEGITDHNSPEAFERINEYNWGSIGDEESNIDIDTPENLFVVGTLGLWNGTPVAVKELSNNVNSIFDLINGYDDASFYVDSEDNELYADLMHHDGTNYLMVREWVDENRFEELEEMILDGKDVKDFVEENSQSVAPRVNEVYGW